MTLEHPWNYSIVYVVLKGRGGLYCTSGMVPFIPSLFLAAQFQVMPGKPRMAAKKLH